MWDIYDDNQIENMQSPLIAGTGRFTVAQFNPNFISKSEKKMIKVVLSAQDNIGGIADVYDFFNVYAENKKNLGMAHHKFKQFLKSIGKLDIYESKSGYQSIIGQSGGCLIKIEKGFPKVEEYIVSDMNTPQPTVQQSTVQHSAPQQQKAPAPSAAQLQDFPDEEIPF
jgi:hypothetical protein